MEERKSTNPAFVILLIAALLAAGVCVYLGLALDKAEKRANGYKSAYEALVEENEALVEENEARAEEAAAAKRTSLQYENDLREVTYLMLDGGVTAENCCNLIHSVWHNCIFEVRDSETDKYTLTESGAFYEDFNDALANLFGDKSFIRDCAALQSNRDDVAARIRNLKNPPDEWRDAYNDLLLYYDSYYDFTDLALYPQCSLNEFKELFKEYDGESLKRFDRMNLYLD